MFHREALQRAANATCTRCAESVKRVLRAPMSSTTDSAQRLRAADIHRSVIVQAPAGSGKTTLLVERFLNLLTVVEQPEEVLAITFTRKAAAEMRERILTALASDGPTADAVRARDLALRWNLDAQPMRLRIQTIDGLAAGLVQRLPIGSRIGSALRVVEDAEVIYQEAITRMFGRLDADDPLGADLVELLELFDNDFDAARASLSRMLSRRDQWLDAAMLALRAGSSDAVDPEQSRVTALTAAMGAGIAALHDAVFEEIVASLAPAERDELAACVAYSSEILGSPWHTLPDTLDGWLFVTDLVTTKSGSPRKQIGQAQGFIGRTATSESMKLRLRSVIDSLVTAGAIERLALIRRLPRQDLDAESVRPLLTVATGLALSVVQLTDLFHRDRVLDFTELTYAALHALGDADAPTDLAFVLDHRIKHILIDEFQDTSAIQHRLVSRLLQGWEPGDGRTLFVVGDPMQSIYRFRDADVALFQLARRHGIGSIPLEPVQLTANFRSSGTLVEWCNATFGKAFGAVEDPIMGRIAFAPSSPTIPGRRDDGCFSHIVPADHPDEEARRLVATVAQIRAAHPGESIAILVRNRSHLDRVLPELSARNIPWVGTDIHLLGERPVIDDLLSLLKCLSGSADRIPWLAFLRSPLVGLSLPDLEAIAAGDIVSAVRSGAIDSVLTASGRNRLQRIRPTLQLAARLRNQIRIRPWLENAFIDLGGADAYADSDALAQASRFFSLLETEHAWTLQFRSLERSVRRLFAQTPASADAVTVMTIHRAKGLEFDHVLLPALNRVNPPQTPPVILWRPQGRELLLGVAAGRRDGTVHSWLRREERERDHHELIRLLYVAATRARFSLHLFATLERTDSTLVAPPDESLMGQIWPIAVDPVDTRLASTSDVEPQKRLRRVLPENYQWLPPLEHRDIEISGPAAVPDSISNDASADAERVIGVVIHRALAALTSSPLPAAPDAYVLAMRRSWRSQLENLGIHGAGVNGAADEIARQLKLVLEDDVGRWILQARGESASEATLTGFDGDDLIQVTPDRTFLDSSGNRWIIDYKSSQPNPEQSHSVFVAAQRRRHVAQLRRYKQVLARLGPEPVRIAIYLTALPALVELDIDLDFSPGRAENRAL
jgi:ATP-dependent exoDNAse (exonuclease V) beta subunit